MGKGELKMSEKYAKFTDRDGNQAKVFKRGDGELYVESYNGEGGQVMAGWWNGCPECGAYQDQIHEIMEKYGDKEACAYALEKLCYGEDGDLCKECGEDGL